MTIELPILGLLKDRPMHGYELREAIQKVVGPFRGVSWGSLYPMLRKLEEGGFIVQSDLGADEPTDRIVYEITQEGELRLIELLTLKDFSTAAGARNDFFLRVAFFHLLDSASRKELMDLYASRVQNSLGALLSEQDHVGQRTNRYRRALLEYAKLRLEADLAWVSRLIEEEREDQP